MLPAILNNPLGEGCWGNQQGHHPTSSPPRRPGMLRQRLRIGPLDAINSILLRAHSFPSPRNPPFRFGEISEIPHRSPFRRIVGKSNLSRGQPIPRLLLRVGTTLTLTLRSRASPPTPTEFFIYIVSFAAVFSDKLEEISLWSPVRSQQASPSFQLSKLPKAGELHFAFYGHIAEFPAEAYFG